MIEDHIRHESIMFNMTTLMVGVGPIDTGNFSCNGIKKVPMKAYIIITPCFLP